MMQKQEITELSPGEFMNFVSGDLVIVSFYREANMRCLMCEPIIESFVEKHPDIKFGRIDIDDSETLKEKCGVTNTPCVIIYKEGKEHDKIMGDITEENLGEVIKKHKEQHA